MKVELQPGDYVPTRLIKTEDEYQAIVEAFLAAGAWAGCPLGWDTLVCTTEDAELILMWDRRDDELWECWDASDGAIRELTPRDVLGNQGRYWDAERRADEAYLDGGEQVEEDE